MGAGSRSVPSGPPLPLGVNLMIDGKWQFLGLQLKKNQLAGSRRQEAGIGEV